MWDIGLIALMVISECLEVGLNTLSKAAMRRGMSNFVFVFYSYLLAFLLLLPSTFIFHRATSSPPKITLSVVCKIFLLGIIGCSLQMFLFTGIGYSSPTLASAVTNLTPAYTFILAVICRMERLDMRIKSSQAKSIGTIIAITGAFAVTLYKGPAVISSSMSSKSTLLLDGRFPMLRGSNWTIGGFLLIANSFLKALLFIIQTWIIKEYPAELMVTLICCFFEVIISAIVSLIAERDPNAWALNLNIEFVTIGYSAFYGIALRTVIHMWALHKRGPVFVTMFKPLGIVIAVIMGFIFLGDTLHLGSVIGGALIALGFYFVMWGNSKEEKIVENISVNCFDSSTDQVPLLQNKSVQV